MAHPAVPRPACGRFAESMLAHMRSRGYDTRSPWRILRRLFLESWAQPGFHRFWRVWNPVYGWGLLKLYLWLGGCRRPVLSSVVTFLFCGLVLHDSITMATSGTLHLRTTFAFAIYAGAMLASRRWESVLRQERWPVALNVVLNVALVALGIRAGMAFNDWLDGLLGIASG